MAEPENPTGPGTNLTAERRGITKVGTVTSNKMSKTIVVRVDSLKPHPRYGRTVRHSAKFMAHDPDSRCGIGDKVKIVESRPLSKSKRWRVLEVLEKSSGVE